MFLPSWKRRPVFHSSLQAENYFAQSFSSQKSAKVLWVCFTAWALDYCLTVLWYLQWRVQPHPMSSTVISSWIPACSVFALFLQQVLLFSTQMWPDIEVSQVPGEVEHPVTLFDIFYTNKSEFQCFKIVYSLQCKYCSSNKYFLVPAQMFCVDFSFCCIIK